MQSLSGRIWVNLCTWFFILSPSPPSSHFASYLPSPVCHFSISVFTWFYFLLVLYYSSCFSHCVIIIPFYFYSSSSPHSSFFVTYIILYSFITFLSLPPFISHHFQCFLFFDVSLFQPTAHYNSTLPNSTPFFYSLLFPFLPSILSSIRLCRPPFYDSVFPRSVFLSLSYCLFFLSNCSFWLRPASSLLLILSPLFFSPPLPRPSPRHTLLLALLFVLLLRFLLHFHLLLDPLLTHKTNVRFIAQSIAIDCSEVAPSSPLNSWYDFFSFNFSVAPLFFPSLFFLFLSFLPLCSPSSLHPPPFCFSH